MELINKVKLYERAASLESQALSYVSKLLERDGGDPSIEWRIWSAILTERTSFKHDVMDAQSLNIVHCCNCKYYCMYQNEKPSITDEDFCSWGKEK